MKDMNTTVFKIEHNCGNCDRHFVYLTHHKCKIEKWKVDEDTFMIVTTDMPACRQWRREENFVEEN